MLLKYKNKIITSIIKNRISQIDYFKKNPYDVQNEVLFDIIEKGYNSFWGNKYNFNKITSYNDYKNNVPIVKYEDVEKYIIDLINGKKNIFYNEPPIWFAKSSGTTNSKSKYIPITKDNLINCHFKSGKDLLSIYCNNYTESKIFEGKGVMIGGSFENHKIGDLSAILIDNMPLWVQMHKAPNKQITLMKNFEKKIKLLCEKTIKENVTNISGVPSWMLLFLNKIIQKTKLKNIKEVWPNLEVFFHGGINFNPYKKQFKKICGEKLNYLETYNASEGFFGIQDDINYSDMLLMLDYGIFYEFISIEDFNNNNLNTITLKDVQKNKNYVLVITTNSGLYRYIIGDTIKFTSINPFKIKITGRTKYFINSFGEEVVVDNTDKALKKCCKATNSSVNEYTVAPSFMKGDKSGFHEWIIEFEQTPIDINHFALILDEEIKKLNSDYEAKRTNNLILKKPKINIAKKGTFYKWLKLKNKLGGQNKIPRLSNNRNYIEEILKLF